MDNYAHLHNHTSYSILDGMIDIEKVVKQVCVFEQPAMAITDHGTMAGAIEFYKLAKKNNIIPIIGQEMYITEDLEGVGYRGELRRPYHMTMLSVTYEGYENLIALNNLGHKQFYYRPLVTFEQLKQMNKSGLVCLSGCVDGVLARAWREGKDVFEVLNWYRELFGNNFYVELMRHKYEVEVDSDQESDFVKLARGYSEFIDDLVIQRALPFVITNDCHYLNAEDEEIHQKVVKISKQNDKVEYRGIEFEGTGYYIKSSDQLEGFYTPQLWNRSLDNIGNIVDQAKSFSIDAVDKRIWHIPYPFDFDAKQAVIDYCKPVVKDWNDEYLHRLAREFVVVEEADLLKYFVIVKDYVDKARERKIGVGPGRGSMSGVMLSYVLDITRIDPIKHDLLFERAINPARPTIPDFDIDFASDRRDEVINYLLSKYEGNALQVGTYGHMGMRGVVRMLGRIFKADYKLVDALAKSVPQGVDGWWDSAFDDSDLKSKFNDEFFQAGNLICGTISNIGRHAAGVVISDDERPLLKEVPIMYVASSKSFATQYDMDSLKSLGFVKFDILGITALTIIERVLNMIEKESMDDVDLEDSKVYELINKGYWCKLFQLEGYSHRHVIKKMGGIKCFEDIVSVLALGRPGILNALDQYLHNKVYGWHDITGGSLQEILGKTHGMILFQEQVMQIGKAIAGLNDAEVDDLKEAIKSLDAKDFGLYEDKFLDGCIGNGLSNDVAQELWSKVKSSAGYLFNRNHAASYALLAYWTAWLKTYYPKEFLAVVWDTVESDERMELLTECWRLGIEIEPPCILESETNSIVKDGIIQLGLGLVKGLGDKLVKSVKEKVADFDNWESKRKENLLGSGIFRKLNGIIPIEDEQIKFFGAPIYSQVDITSVKPYIQNGWNNGGALLSSNTKPTSNGGWVSFMSVITEDGVDEFVYFDDVKNKLKLGDCIVYSLRPSDRGRPVATKIAKVVNDGNN